MEISLFRVLKPFLRKNKNREANKPPRNGDFVVWCVLGTFVFKVQIHGPVTLLVPRNQ